MFVKELYTKNDILNQLNSFEIPKEKIVLIHTSLRSVGSIEGGPKALTFMVGAFFLYY
jgi:aminoglycoside N3'-acetyltransferase